MALDMALTGTPYSKFAFSPDGSLLATLGVTGPAESSDSTTITTTIKYGDEITTIDSTGWRRCRYLKIGVDLLMWHLRAVTC